MRPHSYWQLLAWEGELVFFRGGLPRAPVATQCILYKDMQLERVCLKGLEGVRGGSEAGICSKYIAYMPEILKEQIQNFKSQSTKFSLQALQSMVSPPFLI